MAGEEGREGKTRPTAGVEGGREGEQAGSTSTDLCHCSPSLRQSAWLLQETAQFHLAALLRAPWQVINLQHSPPTPSSDSQGGPHTGSSLLLLPSTLVYHTKAQPGIHSCNQCLPLIPLSSETTTNPPPKPTYSGICQSVKSEIFSQLRVSVR